MTIVIGSGDNAYTYNPSNPSDTSIPAPKSDSKSKTSNKKSDDKKSKQTFRSKFVYGGSEGVDESVDKKNYDNPRKHKLRNQFDYLVDETQEIAKKYGAVCTPDFFGYNKNLELQYRGRFRELKDLKPINNGDSDLKIAMKMVAQTQKGPDEQIPSMGCNIKWFN